MSDNKFIQRLKGKQTPKSVVEVQNDKLVAPFTGVPYSTDVVGGIIDDKDSSVVVAKGAQNWKLNGSSLVVASSLSGDGADYTGEFNASGSGLWINATYSLPDTIFNAGTKWVLKLCGKNLLTTSGGTIGFTLVVKVGNTHITSKTFTVAEGANVFCRQLAIDFSESEQAVIKAQSGDNLTVQLLCSDANASATIYNGMTVLTALQRRVDGDAVVSDKYTFDELAEDLATHIANKNNPHEVTKAQVGLGNCDNTSDLDKPISTATQAALDGKVAKTGDTMSGALNIADIASSNTPLLTLTHSNTATYKWNIAPRYNSTTLSVYPGSTETNGFRFATTGFVPASNNARYLGSASLKWKGVYTGALNNGADLVVPNKAGTLATMSDVELAAQSGTQLYTTGVWYAKMYSTTVVPSGAEYEGRNYADFSQVDSKGNPIIIIYEGQRGLWAEIMRITPPAEYDGYITVTSKIWDIAEQAGQQGGRVLWNHTSRDFTPYPLIVSFEDIEVTGDSTVIMPQNPGANQIVNKDYVDNQIPTVNDATITITQGGVTKGSFTLNQATGDTIDLDAGVTTTGQSIDAEIVGEVVVNGSEVSNLGRLSAGRGYLVLPGSFNLDVTTFEVGIAFTTSNQSGNVSVLTGECTNDGIVKQPTAVNMGYTSANQFIAVVYTNINDPLASTVMITGGNVVSSTKYYLKLVYDYNDASAPYKLYVSTDGINYTVIGQSSIQSAPSDPTQYIIGQGGADLTSVDMAGCYIKRDGQIVWQGMDTPGLLQRAGRGHEVIEFQAPTANNDYTWYRKYADGWVEQGGHVNSVPYGGATITFPITMADTNYYIANNVLFDSTNGGMASAGGKTTTGATLRIYGYNLNSGALNSGIALPCNWQVSGISA